jgi:hypothetical protein
MQFVVGFPSEVIRKEPLMNTPKQREPVFRSNYALPTQYMFAQYNGIEERSTLGSW